MAAILNSAILDSATAILDSDTLLSSLRFTQKHSHSTLTLTQTNSIWLTWWWQPSWILLHLGFSHLAQKRISLFNTQWWWQPSWILPSWICHLGFNHLSFSSQTHSHLPRLVPTICTKKTSLTLASPFAQKELHLLILTQLDDGSHLEICHFRHCHLGFRHLVIFSQIHPKTPLHSDSDSN